MVGAIAALFSFAAADLVSAERQPTRESGIGVWYAQGAPETSQLWRPGDPGERLFLRGRVLDVRGEPVAGALVELWHADANGVVHLERYRAALRTRADGQFEVSTVLPGYIWGPRHIHIVVTDPGHPQLVTRVFFMRDPELAVTGDPELAIVLEDGRRGDERVLLGTIELVLRAP